MPITGDYAALEEQIKKLHKLSQYSCASDIAARANDQLTADELRIFDSRTDPATGAAWDANLDGSAGDQVATGAGRGSVHFEANGYRVRLKFADHLRWNLSWRRGQGRGGQHKQNFIPSMSKLPPTMLATLCRVAREVLSEYTGLEFTGAAMSASELFDALVTELNPQGIAVYYGTGRPENAYASEAEVYMWHPPVADAYQPPQPQTNAGPPNILDLVEAVSFRVEGSSPLPGATYRDQHDAVRAYLARFLVALHNWARSYRSSYEIARAGWDEDKSENPAGAIYLLDARIAGDVLDEPLLLAPVLRGPITTLIDNGGATPVDWPGDPPAPPPTP